MIVCRNTIKEMTVNSIQISGPVGGAEKQIPGLRNGQVERNPHGLGLQIVQEVVAFYNGTFEIKKSEFEYVVRAFWSCNTKSYIETCYLLHQRFFAGDFLYSDVTGYMKGFR